MIKAIQASMSSLRSEFSKLKKLGSLQSSLWAACDLIEPEMLWARSKNAKRRLEAIVEAMDENIENKWLFLLENYYNSLGIKGFSHNCTNSLRTASVYSTGTYAPPCRSKLQALKVGGLKKKSAIRPQPHSNRSARVQERPGSNHSQSLMAGNFAAL